MKQNNIVKNPCSISGHFLTLTLSCHFRKRNTQTAIQLSILDVVASAWKVDNYSVVAAQMQTQFADAKLDEILLQATSLTPQNTVKIHHFLDN